MLERKLSQKKEDIEWRQSRIKDSMNRLDALLAEGKSHDELLQGKLPIVG